MDPSQLLRLERLQIGQFFNRRDQNASNLFHREDSFNPLQAEAAVLALPIADGHDKRRLAVPWMKRRVIVQPVQNLGVADPILLREIIPVVPEEFSLKRSVRNLSAADTLELTRKVNEQSH